MTQCSCFHRLLKKLHFFSGNFFASNYEISWNFIIFTGFCGDHLLSSLRRSFSGVYDPNRAGQKWSHQWVIHEKFWFFWKISFSWKYETIYGLDVWSVNMVQSRENSQKNRYSRGQSVLNKILLGTCVGSNWLYILRRWFPESFKKIAFFFFNLLMASTWLQELLDMHITVSGDVHGSCMSWKK